MISTDRPVMLTEQYGQRAALEATTHLEATHAHQLAQAARQVEAQAREIARLRQDLASARDEIARLTKLVGKVGSYLHDGPEDETG
jgi:hypothetical protein